MQQASPYGQQPGGAVVAPNNMSGAGQYIRYGGGGVYGGGSSDLASGGGYNIQQSGYNMPGTGYGEPISGGPPGGGIAHQSSGGQSYHEAANRGGMVMGGGAPFAPVMPRGIKCSWNLWPPTKADTHAVEIPLSILYTPFDDDAVPVVQYEPIRSRSCGSILNPCAHIDFRGKVWTCPFSLQRTPFPQQYAAHISESYLPLELTHPTIEYAIGAQVSSAPTFVFVIDTCIYAEELEVVKDSLQQALSVLPPACNVGLVTFGTNVHVYCLGFSECPKSYVFRGTKEVKAAQLQARVTPPSNIMGSGITQPTGIRTGVQPGMQGGPGVGAGQPGTSTGPATGHQQQPTATGDRFIVPISEGLPCLITILEDLKSDDWPAPADSRASRCTGAALSAACSLFEAFSNQQGGRVVLFVGGICTVGPGQTADSALSQPIRHHLDLQKETEATRHTKKAIKFYQGLSARALASGHSIDVFASCLDQCGIHEMRVCSEKTGGVIVMSDTFSMHVFRDSIRKMFEPGPDGYFTHAYNARIEIFCSKEVRVCGAIGCCSSTGKKGSQVGEMSIGDENATCEWSCGVIDKTSTFAFYLEVANTNNNSIPANRTGYIQFQVTYKHPSGQRRKRVSTVAFPFAQPGFAHISSGFDQEVAAVIMARLALQKTESEDPVDILRWLDRKLIRLVAAFGDYQKDKPETFQLSPEFVMYPQFMYHLRRSQFLQTFNASPDETAHYRLNLLRETLANSLVMIQPSLIEYSLNCPSPPTPVMLDAQALKNDVVLLLDTFFHVVIWHGDMVCRWKEQGYHEMPEYAALAQIISQPQEDAKAILASRFPVPKFVVCNAGGSQARFLLAKVNPSKNHIQDEGDFGPSYDTSDKMGAGTSILTDDVSLRVFMDHLIKLAVQS